jgi:hypothetical protein
VNHIDRLRALGACWQAIKWAETQPDAITAWRNCENPEWLIWLANRIGATHQQIVLAACACARTALRYIPEEEERPLMAIEAAEAWARGEVSLEEVSAARAASRAAVDAVDAALAAYRAVYAAVAASCAASAAVNASRATVDALAGSRAVDAARAASYAAVDSALAACRAIAEIDQNNREACDKIREILPVVRFTYGLRIVSDGATRQLRVDH